MADLLIKLSIALQDKDWETYDAIIAELNTHNKK